MIDPVDLAIPNGATLQNKLGITEPNALVRASADFTAVRLAELQAAPIRGGFDAAHLQEIHHHLFQDLYAWAGELRVIDAGAVPASSLERSLNRVFDRLARDNHLKGSSPEDWAQSAAAYVYDLGTLQPFLAGNRVALREFARELARRNDLTLRWDATPEIVDVVAELRLADQSANLRRIIMLAMDATPTRQLSSRGHDLESGIERLLPGGN